MSEENKTDKQTTYAVKINESTKQEILELIDQSGQEKAGDFFKLLVESYKTNKLTSGEVDTQAEIKELNQLTTRMYSIYNNLIERNSTNINNVKNTLSYQLEEKNETISELEFEIDKLKILEKSNREYTSVIAKEKDDIEKELSDCKDQLSDKNKYNAMLEEEVEDLKQYKSNAKLLQEENNTLKTNLNGLKNTITQLESTIVVNKQDIDNLNSKLQDAENKHKQELESIKATLELEKQQAILKLQQDHQVQMQEIQNNNIKNIENYQEKYEKLVDKTDAEKEELQKQIIELQKQNKQ